MLAMYVGSGEVQVRPRTKVVLQAVRLSEVAFGRVRDGPSLHHHGPPPPRSHSTRD